MTTPEPWLVWQLADSAFPTGGFAHSGGLEASWQHGEIRSGAEAAGFIRANLVQTGRGSLPFVTEAHGSPDQLAELDKTCDAFLSNHVANRASRAQGQALLVTVERSFGLKPSAPLGHLAPVFGTVTTLLGIERRMAQRLFLFMTLRGLIAATVRLGIMGPMEGQALQFRLSAHAEQVSERCADLGVADIAQTAPVPDLWQGAHDRLYSRLFQT